MKVFTKTQKVFSAISSFVFTVVTLYVVITVLFMTAPVWMANVLMFYMNIMAFALFFSAIFISDEDKAIARQNKVVPLWMEITYDLALAFMFAAAGWWYYAILGVVILFSEMELYSK